MPIGRSGIFLPAEQAHQLLTNRVARVLALNNLADRESAHGIANFDTRPIGAGVSDPPARGGVTGKVVVLNEEFALGEGRNIAIPNVEVFSLRNAVGARLKPNLPIACHRTFLRFSDRSL